MTDRDYEFGTNTGIAGRDQRDDYRLVARATARVQAESVEPSSAPELPARALECQIRDISSRGFRLVSAEPFPVGALLATEAALGKWPQPFALTIEVVWCRQTEEGYLSGIQIVPSDDTDYVEWVEAVAEVLAHS
ncbi:MAG: PilZ domain-containing protein [Pseudomonadota bacterium]|nr:PilZ domain-containing protein [Pseudomonadota bacterium]